MKFSNLNRIYVETTLTQSDNIQLSDDQIHYIKTVLRLKINDQFRIFNSLDGEFIAQIHEVTKNNLLVNIKEHLRAPSSYLPFTLGLAIIKPEKFLLAINMATQLGVTKIIPLVTERCQFKNINKERALKCIIEATEQSELLSKPIITSATKLSDYLIANTQNLLIYANEQADATNSILQILSYDIRNIYSEITFIVGPEGGFTDNELKNFTIRGMVQASSFSWKNFSLQES